MLILKIVTDEDWGRAVQAGAYRGAPVDLKDGFIHFSTAAQVAETAAKHFAGQAGLLLAAFESDDMGDALKWEASRGGDLFPHLYSHLDPGGALWTAPLPLDPNGAHQFPEGLLD